MDHSKNNKIVRGIRNNNPLNIEWGSDWIGLVPPSQRTDKRFCQFENVKYGYRAAFRILLYAYKSRGWVTISEVVRHWAPSHENNTSAYIQEVSDLCGLSPTQRLEGTDYIAVVAAMAKVECGLIPSLSVLVKVGYEQIIESKVNSHLSSGHS